MGLQRVGHDLVSEQQQIRIESYSSKIDQMNIVTNCWKLAIQ